MRRALLAALWLALLPAVAQAAGSDWPLFGYDPARTDAPPVPSGITASGVRSLTVQRIQLPGVVDSSPVYLHGVVVKGALHDVFIVTTSYGRTLAIDADSGTLLWRFAPTGIESWEGGRPITEASPAADPERQFVYAAAPDGLIHKLAVADGRETRDTGWPAQVTLDPRHEKLSAALNLSGSLVFATTSSYGDGRPYQGHVVAIDRASGARAGVFNVICGQAHALLRPGACPRSGGSVWARAGAIVEPGGQRLLVATANGHWNGKSDWGESVLELPLTLSAVLQGWTAPEHVRLDAADRDLGSTGPAILPLPGRTGLLQGGKDGKLRLLDLSKLGGPGAVLQTTATAGHSSVFTTPAVVTSGGSVTAVVANGEATVAYSVGGRHPALHVRWRTAGKGTSPIVSGGLVYVFDPRRGRLRILRASDGKLLRSLPALRGHWNSPVVADGRIALGSGDANEHHKRGTFIIWRASRR